LRAATITSHKGQHFIENVRQTEENSTRAAGLGKQKLVLIRGGSVTDITLSNDDLGDWGESQFRSLCSASGLIANKAERDKMGWDFLVELPPDATAASLPLDCRPNRLGCRVQIKTQWRRDDGRFKMTLSAAQRLAMDPGPSFIIVLTAVPCGEIAEPTLAFCHVIHMLDNNLERVLKRLREAAIDPQNTPLNSQELTYDPNLSGVEILPSGQALRDTLITVCGSDIQAYMAKKDEQKKNLGYASGRYQLSTTITAKDHDEFVEMMLGLRPVSLSKFEAFDARFGKLLPVNHIPEGATYSVEFKPNAAATCTLRIRGAGLKPPAVLRGEVYLPVVRVPEPHMRMLVKAPFLTLSLNAGGKTDVNLDSGGLFEAELGLTEWQSYIRLLTIFGEERLEFDIEGNGQGMPHSVIEVESPTPLPQEPWFPFLIDVARKGEALLKLAGAEGRATSLEKLNDAAEGISWAYARLLDPTEAPPFTFQTSSDVSLGDISTDIECLQADCLVVAEVALAYACKVTMRPEPAGAALLWRQVDIKPERLKVIEETKEAFMAFVRDIQERTGIQTTLIRNLETDGQVESSGSDK